MAVDHQDRGALADVEVRQAKVPDGPVARWKREVREPFETLFRGAVNASCRMRSTAVRLKRPLEHPPPFAARARVAGSLAQP